MEKTARREMAVVVETLPAGADLISEQPTGNVSSIFTASKIDVPQSYSDNVHHHKTTDNQPEADRRVCVAPRSKSRK